METAQWSAVREAGPAAGASIELGAGAHVIGRHRDATIHIEDRLLEPFHAQLDVGDGTLTITHLSGRRPVRVDGAVIDGAACLGGSATSHVVEVGASRLLLTRITHPGAAPADERSPGGVGCRAVSCADGRVLFVRAPRPLPAWAPDPIAVDEPADDGHDPVPGGLVPALVAFTGSVVLAMVMGQPMFLLFGALGAVVALTSWGGQWIARLRRRRGHARRRQTALARVERDLRQQRLTRLAFHRATVSSIPGSAGSLRLLDDEVWARRPDHGDAWTVSLGIGHVGWRPAIATSGRVPEPWWSMVERASTLRAVPVPVDVDQNARIALCGPHGTAVARALVMQLAIQTGPADWQLLIVTSTPDAWAWALDLPHLAGPDGIASIVDEEGAFAALRRLGELGDRHTIIVTDRPDLLEARTSALRRLLASELRPALIAVFTTADSVPSMCRTIVTAAIDAQGRVVADVTKGDLPQPVHIAGLTESDALALACRLGELRDPEDPRASGSDIPATVELASLLGGGSPDAFAPAVIAATWLALSPDAAPEAPIGRAADGVVTIDLVRDGPHALLAGTTGSGKSELLRSLVVGLAARLSPDHLTFVLVDYKGGAAFDTCASLPHVVGMVTDLDEHLAERALRSLRGELRAREHTLRAHGAIDLADLRRRALAPVIPRLVVVVDEFAALAVEQAAFLHALVDVAQRGRSLGVHLILATQRPSGVISDDIRANTNLRLALRLHDTMDALDVIGDPAPALLPRRCPGRAVMRLGPDEYVTFQTARCTTDAAEKDATGIEAMVAAISAAASMLEMPAPRRPWCDRLPSSLEPGLLDLPAIGLVDLPDEQTQRPLVWSPGDGNLLVVGARGSGVTSTLRTVVTTAAEAEAPPAFVVIDGHDDRGWDDVAAHPRCVAVVRRHERERLLRVLTRLTDPATATAGDDGGTLVVIDGIGTLRAEFDAVERSAERDAFDRLVGDAGARGATLLLGADGAAAVPPSVLARCAHRWVMHLHDPHDGMLFGLASSAMPGDVAGRLAIAATGAHAQVIAPRHSAAARVAHLAPVERLRDVATVVGGDLLPAGRRDDVVLRLPLGLGIVSGEVHELVVPGGEHVAVLGPGRSGRSSVLVRIAQAWREADPNGWVGMHAPRRSPLSRCSLASVDELLDALPAVGPALLIIDDAELVDDPGQRLNALLASRRPDLTVAIAARPDALRQAYGHWTTLVRRSRLGVLMAGSADLDGDLLAATVPRWLPLAVRPGLAHAVDEGAAVLVQCGLDRP